MRAESLPRCLQSLVFARSGVIVLVLLIVSFAPFAFGALVAVPGPIQILEPNPFRWT